MKKKKVALSETIQRTLRFPSWLFEILACGVLLVLVLLFAYEVIARYVFGNPTGWVNQVGGYATAGICLLALGATLLRDEHIRIDILVERLGGVSKTVAALVGEVIGLLFAALMTYTSIVAIQGARQYNIQSFAASFRFPEYLPMLVLAIGFATLTAAQISKVFSVAEVVRREFGRGDNHELDDSENCEAEQ